MGSVTVFLIAINIGAYLLQQMYGDGVIAVFALWPVGNVYWSELDYFVGFKPWQLVTSAFLHGGQAHLLLNMFGLFMFGRDVEAELGSHRYLALYLSAVLFAALAQLIVMAVTGAFVPTLGASGGVFGILLAFGMMFPNRMVMLLIPPIPMRAWVLVTVYGGIELLNGVFRTSSGIAHFAHLGGMVGAFILLWYWRRSARPRRR